MRKLTYILFAALFSVWACDPEIDDIPSPSSRGSDGSEGVDLSKYVAAGNSLTAGLADGALYREAQLTSFPSILGQQFAEAGGPSEFAQPLMPEGNGWGIFGGTQIGRLVLTIDPTSGSLLPGPTTPSSGATDKVDNLGPFNNLGVPGIAVRDILTPGYGADPNLGNPYFYRMIPAANASQTYVDALTASNATFFTNWLGSNDVLGYATSGGLEPLTDVALFETNYAAAMNAFGNAKGVCITIPDVTTIPFFTFIPWNALVLEQDQADLANASYEALIDPDLKAGVEDVIIPLVSTDTVVKVAVIPDVATGAVYQQAFDGALAQGADSATADATATAFVQSPDGQASIGQLAGQLGDELLDHLQGNPTSPELDPLFAIIDNELATNATLQAAIAQTVTDTRAAYDAELLPDLVAAVDAEFTNQKAGLQALGIYPVFVAGPNPFVIEVEVTETNPLGIRFMTENELILFSANLAGELTAETAPLPKPDQYILTSDELDPLNARRDALNSIIRGYESANVTVLDIDRILTRVNEGYFINGQEISGEYATGGAFSLDAVHLTPRGYAIVANEIVAKMNSKFKTTISPVNVTDFRANEVP